MISPLVGIDKIADSSVGCEMMTLLDYFSGYHQIWFYREDEEKTSFITPFRIYCYLRMPEGLPDGLTRQLQMLLSLWDPINPT
jgi:hypothetical protein